MLKRLVSFLLLLGCLASAHSFQRLPPPPAFMPPRPGSGSGAALSKAQQRAALMRREVVPQIMFAAACAGGAYVGWAAGLCMWMGRGVSGGWVGGQSVSSACGWWGGDAHPWLGIY